MQHSLVMSIRKAQRKKKNIKTTYLLANSRAVTSRAVLEQFMGREYKGSLEINVVSVRDFAEYCTLLPCVTS